MSTGTRRRLRRAPHRHHGDDGAAMMTVLMLIMIVGTLSILVLGTVVSQVRPVAFAQKSGRTIFAAEAGVQATLGEFRTSRAPADINNDVYGDPAKLPCALNGRVGDASQDLQYSVTIQYFETDPSTESQASPAQPLTCGLGGTLRGLASVPAYAVITSQGLAAGVPGLATDAGDRQLQTQYAFQLTNKNVPGGLFRTSDKSFCLVAGSASSGSYVRYRADCSARTPLMLWVHAEESYLQLASTVGTSTPLCLQGPSASSGSELVQLRPCDVIGPQLFSYKGSFRYQAQNDANSTVGQNCLWAGSQTTALDGRRLRSSSDGCVHGGDSQVVQPYWSWNPEPAVGAGSASQETSQQLINYAEFGRCFEVTQENLAADRMGIGPCKQDLPGNGNRWNQVWVHAEPAEGASSVLTSLSVTKPDQADGGQRCLTLPVVESDPVYPVLGVCNPADPDQQFTRTTKTNAYDTSYLILDRLGRCLAAGPTYTPDGSTLTSVVVEACTGDLGQKWNAPPNLTPPDVSHTQEGS